MIEEMAMFKLVIVFIFSLIQFASDKPSKGDYLCWANPVKDCKNCDGVGTYAWHPNKEKAIEMAMRLCQDQYGACELDYCKQIKK